MTSRACVNLSTAPGYVFPASPAGRFLNCDCEILLRNLLVDTPQASGRARRFRSLLGPCDWAPNSADCVISLFLFSPLSAKGPSSLARVWVFLFLSQRSQLFWGASHSHSLQRSPSRGLFFGAGTQLPSDLFRLPVDLRRRQRHLDVCCRPVLSPFLAVFHSAPARRLLERGALSPKRPVGLHHAACRVLRARSFAFLKTPTK